MTARQLARSQGLLTYIGKPCKTCKCTERLVSNGHCRKCSNGYIGKKNPIKYQKRLEYQRKYSETHKEENKVRCSKHRKDHPELYRYYANKRRALKLGQTPKYANLEKMREIYQNCPKGYEVDHIVPLNGKYVCGLHIEWNLQYLTAEQNRSKGNRI